MRNYAYGSTHCGSRLADNTIVETTLRRFKNEVANAIHFQIQSHSTARQHNLFQEDIITRKPRFSNRRRSTGWLPPSLRSRLAWPDTSFA